MSEIGELIKEAMNEASQNMPLKAFNLAAKAFDKTAHKYFENAKVSDLDKRKLFYENWWMLHFLTMPYSVPVSEEIIQEATKKAVGFSVSDQIEDILFYIVRHNFSTNGMPVGFGFNSINNFALQHNQILIPERLVLGLIGVVIFNPINVDENIQGDYWFEFGGFRMFVSELWGRSDLVERVMKLS